MSTETPHSRSYWCFISYRHDDNRDLGRQWATWLHQAIETYEVPADLIGTQNERGETIPERIFPVFRDEEELPVEADLASPIYRALEASKYLLVICSPRAVQSSYVAGEIRYFKQLGREDRVLAAMIEGEPNASWDQAKHASGFSADQECFPDALRHKVAPDGSILSERAEPVAADFRLGTGQGWTSPEAYRLVLRREGLDRKDIDAQVEAYRKKCDLMKLKVIAGILGISLGVLTKRDTAHQLAQAQTRAVTLRRWLTAVAVLLGLAVVAGIYACRQTQETKVHLDAAVALNLLDGSPSEGLRLALCAADNCVREFGAPFSDVQKSLTTTLSLASEMTCLDPGYTKLDASATSAGGTRVLMAGDGRLTLFDVVDKKKICAFTANPGVQSAAVALNTRGDLIASASKDGRVRWWNSSGRLLGQLPILASGWVTALAFSPDEQKIVTAGTDLKLHLWDLRGNELPSHFVQRHTNPINCLLFRPDGNLIASADSNGTDCIIQQWNLDGSPACPPITAESQGVTCLAFSPDGKTLASGGPDALVRFWNVQGTSSDQPLGAPGGIQALNFSRDGTELVVAASEAGNSPGSKNTVSLWQAHGFMLKSISTDHIRSVAFGPEETIITVGDDRLCRVNNFQPLHARPGFNVGHYIGDLAVLPDGKTVAVGNSRGGIDFFNFDGAPASPTLKLTNGQESATTRFMLNPAGDMLGALVKGFSKMKLWNGQKGWTELNPIDNSTAIDGFAFSSVSGRVALGMDNELWIRDLTGKLIAKPAVDSQSLINEIAFSPDGKLFAAANITNAIPLWDSEGRPVASIATENLGTVSLLGFSPGGRALVAAFLNGYVAIYDLKSHKRIVPLMRLGENGSVPKALAFSPDGQRIACAGQCTDGAILQIWDAGGNPLTPPIICPPAGGGIFDLSFTPDGKILVTGNIEGEIEFWAADWQSWIDLACARLRNHPIIQADDVTAHLAKAIIERRLVDDQK